ncbi:MAG: hypothetical protein PHT44_03575 [Candidatus Portnoybacteria bacterium]|nr:hypothetical protein [Candidatus Portnoybacteria bacterium]MDD4983092.1 hypothetical protein [Candidatus Portnoybacteria bacterium]
MSDLLYIADDIRSNPEEIVITDKKKTELVKSLTCAFFDLYLTVEENRGDAVGRGVTIEINTSWDADIDWSKAAQA